MKNQLNTNVQDQHLHKLQTNSSNNFPQNNFTPFYGTNKPANANESTNAWPKVQTDQQKAALNEILANKLLLNKIQNNQMNNE